MTTKNHKSATTSDILPGTPSSDPSSEALLAKEEALLAKEDPRSDSLPPKSSLTNTTRARCGKVARLPKEIRDQINQMLLDGIPHAQIIQTLRDKFESPASAETNVVPLDSKSESPTAAASDNSTSDSDHAPAAPKSDEGGSRNTQHDSAANPPGPSEDQSLIANYQLLESLTPHHITTWKKFGGYRDWLKDQQRIADCKLRHELTLDLAQSSEGLASYQAAPKVAVAQICQTIIDLGPDGLKHAMKDSPLNCFRLLNALARLINSGLKCESHVIKHAAESRPKPRNGFTPDVVEKMETSLNMM